MHCHRISPKQSSAKVHNHGTQKIYSVLPAERRRTQRCEHSNGHIRPCGVKKVSGTVAKAPRHFADDGRSTGHATNTNITARFGRIFTVRFEAESPAPNGQNLANRKRKKPKANSTGGW